MRVQVAGSRVRLDGLSAGEPVYRLVDGERVLIGVGTSGAVYDVGAPLSGHVEYEHAGESAGVDVTNVRDVYGDLSSVDGRVSVDVNKTRSWPARSKPDVAVFHAGGRTYTRSAEHAKPMPVRVTLQSTDVDGFEALLARQQPVVFRHAECPLPGCPVPYSLVAVISDVSGELRPRRDMAEMEYEIELTPIDGVSVLAPVSTWGELADSGMSWGDVAGMSWGDIAEGGWL